MPTTEQPWEMAWGETEQERRASADSADAASKLNLASLATVASQPPALLRVLRLLPTLVVLSGFGRGRERRIGPWPDEGERGGDDDDDSIYFVSFLCEVLQWLCAS